MLRIAVALVCVAGCGRIGFDPAAGADDGGGGLSIRYRNVPPVLVTDFAIAPLVPTVTGTPTAFAIAPGLPSGLDLDPTTGTIVGIPTTVTPPTSYTVTAADGTSSASTTLELRTADGYIVNTAADGTDASPGNGVCEATSGGGDCTLRAAVAEVNADGGAKSVIYIAVPSITLGGSLPDAVESIEMVGQSAAATVVDANKVGPLISFGADSVQLTLSYLTYRNGAGTVYGNFKVNTLLHVDHVVVTGCDQFTDLATNQSMTWVDSTFDSNTGDLVTFSGPTATIDRCTFVGNTASVNGMLYFVFGNVTITNSTFTGNSGAASPIMVNNATTALIHNTIAGNTATGSFRGGAVSEFSGGSLAWANNLVANNTGDPGNCNVAGSGGSSGGNLEFPGGSCGFVTPSDPPSADPQLAALADNGGATQTIALGQGSPAIDAAGTAVCPPIDQRGVARPQGAACDIGAFEWK